MHLRRRSPWRLHAASIAFAVLFRAGPALADSRPELRSRLVYSAPSTCPGEDHFLALLARHSDVVVDGAAPIVLRVEVVRDQKRHRGRVTLLTTEEEGVREVVADRCEDVVRGLALFSSIALDAYFERHLTESPRPATEPPPATESLPAPRSEPSRRRTPLRVRRPAPPRPVPPRMSLGLGLGQQGATGTRVVGYVGAFGEIELPWTLRSSIRLSTNLGAVIPQSYGDGTLSFGMGWARVDVCPAWALLARTLFASVCPTGEGGLQRAALEGTAVGRTEVRPWVAAGGVGRVRTRLGHTVELAASAGAVAPLLPFDFRTRAGVAYSTPTLAPVVEFHFVVPLF